MHEKEYIAAYQISGEKRFIPEIASQVFIYHQLIIFQPWCVISPEMMAIIDIYGTLRLIEMRVS